MLNVSFCAFCSAHSGKDSFVKALVFTVSLHFCKCLCVIIYTVKYKLQGKHLMTNRHVEDGLICQ